MLLYKDLVASSDGIAPTSHTWAKKNIFNWSDDEIKLDLEQQRLERAATAELEKTPEVITKTGFFTKIDKLYGDILTPKTSEAGEGETGEAGGFGGDEAGGFGGDEAGGDSAFGEGFRGDEGVIDKLLLEGKRKNQEIMDMTNGIDNLISDNDGEENN